MSIIEETAARPRQQLPVRPRVPPVTPAFIQSK